MRIWLAIVLTLLFPRYSWAQCNTEVSICETGAAGPFTFVTASEEVGTCQSFINGLNSPNYGFILLYITESGPLSLLIEGNVSNGYIDVSIYNIPPGEDPCEAITNDANQIGCNFADANGGCNEFGTFFNCSSQAPSPNVNAGDIIMILIEDYSDTQVNFTLELGPAPNAQTGALDATIQLPPSTTSTADGPFQVVAEVGGGIWSADCGPCIDPDTGEFDPAIAGVGIWEVCYEIGEAPCDNSDCLNLEVICGSSAEISGNESVCQGEPATILVSFTGEAPWDYEYTLDGVSQGVVSTFDNPHALQVTNVGTYELLSVIDNICEGIVSGSAEVSALESPSIIDLSEECSLDGLTYTVSFEIVGGDPTSYQVVGLGGILGSIFTSNPILGGETYSFDILDGNACSIEVVTGNVSCICPAVATLSGVTNLCASNASDDIFIDFEGTAPWTFDYALNGLFQGVIVTSDNPYTLNITTPGDYLITALSDAICDADVFPEAYTVDPISLPTATIDGIQEICLNEIGVFQIGLTGTGPWSVEYETSGNLYNISATSSTYTLNTAEEGFYTITNVVDQVCSNIGDGVGQLIVHDLPEANLVGDVVLCEGGEVELSINLMGDPNFILEYSVDGIIQPLVNISDENEYDLVVSQVGTFDLISIEDLYCIGTALGTSSVTQEPLPTGLFSGDFTICDGDSQEVPINLTGSSPWTINYTIDGVAQPGITTTDSNYSLQATQEGIYTMTNIDDLYCNNPGAGLVDIDFYPPILLTTSLDSGVCIGEQSSGWASASGGIGEPYSYSWTGNELTLENDTTVTLFGDQSTVLSVTANDLCGYSETAILPITIHQLPPIGLSGPTSKCGIGYESIVNATPLNYVGSDCQWIVNGDSISSNCGNINYFFGDIGAYDIDLMVTSPEGCVNQVLFEEFFEIYTQPISSFSFTPDEPSVVNPTISFTNESTGEVTGFEWSIGDLAYFQDENISYDFPADKGPDDWLVCLSVVTEDFCVDNSCLPIGIKPEILSHIANSFTPNGDGLNEFFDPFLVGLNPDYYECLIYDRTGKLVFESRDIMEKWNGSYFNNDQYYAMNGIYNWQIIVRLDGSSDNRLLQGWVNLMR